MATIQIVGDGILTDSSMSSDGSSTITREIVYSGDTGTKITDIISSPLYPQHKSALPTDSRFYLDDISCQQDGDIPPTFKATARYKHSYGALDLDRNGNRITSNTKPWLLPISDLESSFTEIEWPLDVAWVKDEITGEYKITSKITNSAGQKLTATRVINIRSLSFTFNMRHTGETPTWNTEPEINNETIRVAGVKIYAGCGKLMPITSRLITVYESDGRKVKWEYWSCKVEIKIHPDFKGWCRTFLDVGTMCMWPSGEDDKLVLGAIYKYTPWITKEDSENVKVVPKFGSLNDVVEAKNKYADLFGEKGTSDYNSAWQRLPWEEITEPMPLNSDGTLDTYAIEHGAEVDFYYRKLEFWDFQRTIWDHFNFPEWR